MFLLNDSLARIHTKLRQLVTNVCYDLEQTHAGVTNIITPEGLRTSPLRLLFYHPSTNTQRAGAHYDKSLITLKLAESHEGLQITTSPTAPLTPVKRSDDKAVLFVSPRFSGTPFAKNPVMGHFPDSVLKPAWHDVVASSTPNAGRTVPVMAAEVCARWALIYFVNEHDFLVPSKQAMHNQV